MNNNLQMDNFNNQDKTLESPSFVELQYIIEPGNTVDTIEMLYRNYFYDKMDMTAFLVSCEVYKFHAPMHVQISQSTEHVVFGLKTTLIRFFDSRC